jgi:hypothetical protein
MSFHATGIFRLSLRQLHSPSIPYSWYTLVSEWFFLIVLFQWVFILVCQILTHTHFQSFTKSWFRSVERLRNADAFVRKQFQKCFHCQKCSNIFVARNAPQIFSGPVRFLKMLAGKGSKFTRPEMLQRFLAGNGRYHSKVVRGSPSLSLSLAIICSRVVCP